MRIHVDKLQPFDEEHTCSKCGREARWIEHCRDAVIPWEQAEYPIDSDCLRVVCGCGYHWAEKTATGSY